MSYETPHPHRVHPRRYVGRPRRRRARAFLGGSRLIRDRQPSDGTGHSPRPCPTDTRHRRWRRPASPVCVPHCVRPRCWTTRSRATTQADAPRVTSRRGGHRWASAGSTGNPAAEGDPALTPPAAGSPADPTPTWTPPRSLPSTTPAPAPTTTATATSPAPAVPSPTVQPVTPPPTHTTSGASGSTGPTGNGAPEPHDGESDD